MDISRLFIGIVMLLPVAMVVAVVAQVDTWRAAVMALHLNWEREQRQAGTSGVPFPQRQAEQTKFEVLVSSRPIRMVWLHGAITLAAILFALLLAWRLDDVRFSLLWLVVPLGLAAITGGVYAYMQLRAATARLGTISATLYGPPPPRVKVRSIQVQEPES